MDDTEQAPNRGLSPTSRPASLRLRVGVGAAVLVAVAVAVIAVAVTAAGSSTTSTLRHAVTVATDSGTAPDQTAAPGAAPLLVHVLGAVARPGLYQLKAGARVVDAVGAAGGLTADAEPAGVNLARPVSDGEQLVVPRVGEAPSVPSVPGPAAGQAAGGTVNLNTASQQELETLPRVGPALAQRILAWRSQNGRFATVEDLKNVTGIGDKTFEQLKDLVTV